LSAIYVPNNKSAKFVYSDVYSRAGGSTLV
jgi:hypothetical protein